MGQHTTEPAARIEFVRAKLRAMMVDRPMALLDPNAALELLDFARVVAGECAGALKGWGGRLRRVTDLGEQRAMVDLENGVGEQNIPIAALQRALS